MNITHSNKKIYLIIVLLILIPILFVIFSKIFYFEDKSKKITLNNAINTSRNIETKINDFLNHTSDNLSGIKNSYFFKEYLSNKSKENKKNLEMLFTTILDGHKNYFQLRVLSKEGFEELRIERENKTNKIQIIDDVNLQDKSNRYYFKVVENQKNENVWFSAIDLNIENGIVEKPFKPTLRAVLPIVTNNSFNGAIVININVEDFISTITNDSFFDFIYFDNQGYTIYHYAQKQNDFTKSWGNTLNSKYNIKEDFPLLHKKIISSKKLIEEDFISKNLDTKIFNGLNVVLKINENYNINQEKNNTNFLIASFFITIISIYLAYILFKRYSSTILNLEKVEKLNTQLETNTYNLEIQKLNAEQAFAQAKYEKERSEQALEEAKVSEEEAVASQEELLLIQEELLYANEAKSEFLANMSHEIRTPLNGIIGLVDLLLEDKIEEKKTIEYLNIIKKSSKTLKGIINDILDFSKIQSGKFQLNYQEFNLELFIKEIENLFLAEVLKKGLKLEVHIDPKVENYLISDSLRIKQILTNIISNAIKFTSHGMISLTILPININNNTTQLKFIITDTGIGIPEKVQDTIFESFEQGEMTNTKEYQGTGLGLAISKSLTNLLGGDIWFESKIGIGTNFYIKLPFKFTKKENVSIKSLNEKKTQKVLKDRKKVLVAEDSEVNQLVIKKNLEKLNFDVELVSNGQEAVTKAKENKYDIIFMDIQMPLLDGYEATFKIRLFDTSTPIIALSAAVLDKDQEKSRECGMDAHLKKPIDKDELLNELEKYFELISIEKNQNEENSEQLINLETLDLKELNNELQMEKNELFILLKKFHDDYKDFQTKLSKEEINSKKYYSLIHKLKGGSANLKMNLIYHICIDIENKDSKKNIDLTKKLVENLSTTITEIEKKIIPQIEKTVLEKEDLLNHIKELIDDLEDFKFIKNNRYEILYDSLDNLVDKNIMKKLKENFDIFSRDVIIEILNEIKDDLRGRK